MADNVIEGIPNLNSDILVKFWNPILEIDEGKMVGLEDVFRRYFIVYLLNLKDDVFGTSFAYSNAITIRSKHILNKMQELTFLDLNETPEDEDKSMVFRDRRHVALFNKPRTRNFDDAATDPYLTLFNRIYPELKKITLAQKGELNFPLGLKGAFSESEQKYWQSLFTDINSMDFQNQPRIDTVFDTKSILKFKTDVRFIHMLLWVWATHGVARVRQQTQLAPVEKVAMFDDNQPSLEFWLRVFRITEKLISVNYRDVTPEDIVFVRNETIKGLGQREEILRPVIAELLQRMATIVMPEFPQSETAKGSINYAVHVQNGVFWLNLLHILRPASFPFLERQLRNLKRQNENLCPDWDGVFKIYFEKFLLGMLKEVNLSDRTGIIYNFLIDIPEKIFSTPRDLEEMLEQLKQLKNIPDLPDLKRINLLFTLLEKLIHKTLELPSKEYPMIEFCFNDTTENFFWKRMNITLDKLNPLIRDKIVNHLMDEPVDIFGKNLKFYYLILFNSFINYLDRSSPNAIRARMFNTKSSFESKNVFSSRVDDIKKAFHVFERPEQFDLTYGQSSTTESSDDVNKKMLSFIRWISSLGDTVQEPQKRKLPCERVLESLGSLPDCDLHLEDVRCKVQGSSTDQHPHVEATSIKVTTSDNPTTEATPESTDVFHSDNILPSRSWLDFVLNRTELEILK